MLPLENLNLDRLVMRRLERPGIWRENGLITPKDRPLSPAAQAFVEAIEALVRDSGLETRLSRLGIDEASITLMAQDVVTGLQRLIASNPRDMDEAQVQAIYRGIY